MLILVMVVFLVFLVLGMPIAFCMALSAGAAIVLNPSLPATIVAQKIYTAVDSISFIAIPLFMMAGSLMNSTGITDKIIEFFENLVGHITGGLAHAVVLTGMLMAGVSGSSVADAAWFLSSKRTAMTEALQVRSFPPPVLSAPSFRRA